MAVCAELNVPLGNLLASGGDTRLEIDPKTLLNNYGCSPFPRPKAYTFASSTATSISDLAYSRADVARSALCDSRGALSLEQRVHRQYETLREELITYLQLCEESPEVIFSPSGTDSQLHALFIARTILGGDVCSIVVGADETGSGTANAALGRHFNDRTANGERVTKGAPIAGLSEGNSLLEIPVRAKQGEPGERADLDDEVLSTVAHVIASGRKVMLQVMDCSKLGTQCPSPATIERLRREHGQRVQVVVDACQARLSRARLKWYLRQDCMVVITGSKFFTGPPFCGALLVPAGASPVMAAVHEVPRELCAYTNRCDWPVTWSRIRESLPDRTNLGELLRWVAASEEIRLYFQVPRYVRSSLLQRFASVVGKLIARNEVLQPLPAQVRPPCDIDEEEMQYPTIFPFFVRGEGGPMSLAAATSIYRALNRDVAHLLPGSATTDERELGRCLCHIGQPVPIRACDAGMLGAIRISAGARFVYGGWLHGADVQRHCEAQLEQIRVILRKIEILQKYFSRVEPAL